jgi:hypothetical protein
MSNDFDPKLAKALIASLRTNRALLDSLIAVQLRFGSTDEELSKAVREAETEWTSQLNALEEYIRG